MDEGSPARWLRVSMHVKLLTLTNFDSTGDFAQTTNTEENAFVKDGELWIKPTLQDENLINKNSVVDLTKQGICTSKVWRDCHAVTNTTNGTIVNPIKSARLNTKKGASIQYGRRYDALFRMLLKNIRKS